MILSNREIQRAIDNGQLIITPEPLPRQPAVGGGHCPYDTHTVDLKLAAQISVPKNIGVACVDLSRPGEVALFLKQNSEPFTLSEQQPFKLNPNQFVLGKTLENVTLPIGKGKTCLAARIEGKSSRARFGLLIHFTAPTVHPGFDGTLTLEMINLGPWPIELTPEMAIAQLIVEQVLGRPFENPSQFQGQSSPEGVVDRSRPISLGGHAKAKRKSPKRTAHKSAKRLRK
ncbi:MAG: dCTP deaminase [Pirellulaceae bacterium]